MKHCFAVTATASGLPRLRGRVGVGVFPQNALVEGRDLPPPAALRAIAEALLRRSYLRTAAEGGLCSPASGRGGPNMGIAMTSNSQLSRVGFPAVYLLRFNDA